MMPAAARWVLVHHWSQRCGWGAGSGGGHPRRCDTPGRVSKAHGYE